MSLIATYYSSDDAGAPALSGQAGSLATLLDALLVDGYGTGPSAKAGLGWTREFSTTNKRVYRNNPVSGTGSYLRVDDSASVGNARYAWVRAFESMSGVDEGTGPAPTVAQQANGLMWAKSSTLDGTARPWWAIGNERALYVFLGAQAASSVAEKPYFAGDLKSHRPLDGFEFVVSGGFAADWNGSTGTILTNMFCIQDNNEWRNNPNNWWGFILRNHIAEPGAVIAGMTNPSFGIDSVIVALGSTGGPYPNPVSDGVILEPVYTHSAAWIVRGSLPGVYAPAHQRPFGNLASVPLTDGFPPGTLGIAKNFQALDTRAAGAGQVLFDVTNEW